MPSSSPSEHGAKPGTCFLVVGMHRSGTSATAAALASLGLALPSGEDLAGPVHGNAKGQYESRSLMRFAEDLLARAGRSWDDPPPLEGWEEESARLARRLGASGRRTFEGAFPDRGAPVVFKDPRSALLLPFWRRVLKRPLAAVLTVRSPGAVARSLERRDALSPTEGLALWERYNRHALAWLRGLPVFVSPLEEALARPAGWRKEVAAFLEEQGAPPPDDELPTGFEPALLHGSEEADTSLELLSSQRELCELLASLAGPHEVFMPPAAGAESPWAAAALAARHEVGRLWSASHYLARSLDGALAAQRAAAPAREEPPYPKDATEDEERYHAWLRERGEPVSVGSQSGPIRPATKPPRSGQPLFSVVVPSYRPPRWALERCVLSVLSQDFASYELVVVDDASGDPSLESRLRELSQLDPRVKVATRKLNGGISAATNDGLSLASGRFVVFLDHDDELAAGALRKLAGALEAAPQARLLYSDEDKIDEEGRRFMPSFKPGWSPDLLLSNAYMCHVLVVEAALLSELGGLRGEFDGAQDYDLMLRATERLAPEEIRHLPEILYHWRTIVGSASGDATAKPWAFEAGRRAVAAALERRGVAGEVTMHPRVPGSYQVHRRPRRAHLVSAVVPFRDEPALLAACYRAFVEHPGEVDFELLLVDNDSVLPETRAVVAELVRDRRVRHLAAPGPFDWVRINNEAVAEAAGDLVLFLNNDVEARSPNWLAQLAAQAEREEVGAVGARLLYPDGTVQHGGVAVGVCFGAAHLQQGIGGDRPGYLSALSVTRDCSAVTGACLMTRRELFESLGGFDAALPVAFNDVDFCLRLREEGFLVVYEPLSELVHHESKSRGHTDDALELPYFRRRWQKVLYEGDPYYNPNLGRFDSFCRLPHERDEERWETFRSMLNMSSPS